MSIINWFFCCLVFGLMVLQILEFDGSYMTCVAPTGRRVFLPQVPDAEYKKLLEAYKSTNGTKDDDVIVKEEGEVEQPRTRGLRKRKSEVEDGPRKKQQKKASENGQSGFEVVIPVSYKQEGQEEKTKDNTSAAPENDVKTETDTESLQSSSFGLTLKGVEVVVLHKVSGPTYLGNKMIELDGRIKHIPNGNAWKEFRCYRNNQDMGSLWEVRQAWYVKRK